MNEKPISTDCSDSSCIFDELAAKIAALPPADREPLQQDLQRLRASLEPSRPADENALGIDEILDNMLGECQVLDDQGRYVHLNAQARRMFRDQGIDPDSLIGKSMFGEVLPDLPESATTRAARQVIATQTPLEVIEHFEPWKRWWLVRVVPRKNRGVLIFSKDITERMRVIEALKQSEKNLSDLIQYAPAGIYEIDFRTHRFTTVNDAMCELSGYSRAELLAMDAFTVLDEASRKVFQNRIQRWLSGEKPEENVEYRVTRKDGSQIDVLLNVTFKKDDSGHPIGATVVGFDVTQAKTIERERQEANRKAEENRLILEAVIQQMPAGVVLTGADGQPEKANAEMDRIWRRSPLPQQEDRPGEHFAVLAGDRALPLADWPLAHTLRQGGAVLAEEMTIRREDGTDGCIEASASPIFDQQGRAIAGVIIASDVTGRKQADAALRDSQSRLIQSQALMKQLLTTSYEGVWAVDHTGRTTFINPRAAEILGYTIEEVRDRSAFEFLMAEHTELGRETLARILRGESGRTEAHAQHKDGREMRLLVSFSPLLDAQGQLDGAMAMFSDITEIRRAEEELARKEADLREAQRIAHLGSWYWDIKTGRTTGSEELLRIYGLDPEKDTLLPFAEQRGRYYPEEAWDWLNAISQEALRTGNSYEVDLAALRNGEQIWVTARGEAVRDRAGQVIGLRGTLQDITERKRFEKSLRESEVNERARAREVEALMDTVPAMIWISRDPRCEMMIGNQYGYQFLRMGRQENLSKTAPAQELARQPFQNYKNGQPLSGEEMPMQIAAATGQPARDFEFDIQFDSGELYHLLGNVNPLFDQDGKPSGAVGAFIDVTALRRLQMQQVEALAEREVHHRLMEQREKERQSYARDIHDGPVQTLSSIGFNLQFIKEAYADPALRVELDQIGLSVKEAVQELRQLINELRPPSVIRFGLARAIQRHAEELQERYPQIHWLHRLSDDMNLLPEPVCLALYRIYQEAVTNVVRHSGATRAWVRYQVKPQQLLLEIRDNGKGFADQHDVERLTRANHFGLAGIFERAEAIGGTVKLITEPGKGTTVLVKVPREKK